VLHTLAEQGLVPIVPLPDITPRVHLAKWRPPGLGLLQLAATVAAHLTELIEMSLDATGSTQHPGADHGVRAAPLTLIKADIHRDLTDSSLTAAAIAARHGITVRYLHKLFEDEAMTFSRYVLDGRLALARQLLSNPRFAGRTISSIAGAAGFGNLSYFNRAFRRRYSVTPSDVRRSVRDSVRDLSCLTARIAGQRDNLSRHA
jgi:AraC-like DNA-binding protein